MPVRTVKNGPPGKVIVRIAGMKSIPPAIAESPLEFDFSILLEADPAVISYETQPIKIRYFFEGKKRTYTPDFLVTYQDRQELVEVKPQEIAETEQFRRWQAAVEPCIRQMGYAFRVVTCTEIRREPRLSNQRLLLRYLNAPPDKAHLRQIEDLLQKGCLTLGDARVWCQQQGMSINGIFHLMATGSLEFDSEHPITDGLILGGAYHA